MILSRTLAKRRIARGERPGSFAAWGLVLGDALALAAVFALLWSPLLTAIYVMQVSNVVTALIFFVVFFVPTQVVLILSSLWAARSRWQDKETENG